MSQNTIESSTIETTDIESQVETSSGNVFADLELPDAPELLVKAQLSAQIIRALRVRGLTQKAAAHLSGLKQPDISNICNGRMDGISVERLFLVLNRLGHSIEIRVSADAREDARTLVCA